MKKNITYLAQTAMALLMLCLGTYSFAQGTEGSGLVLRVIIDGTPYDYNEGACGYGTASWGGSVTEEFCKPVVWAYDITPDTLCCDSIPAGSLTGKIAMIRRGACQFGLKSLNAEKAGAMAVMIANNNASTAGDDCNAIPMGAGDVGNQVTIPAIFICRNIATQIDNAMKAGQNIEICFLLPRVSSPYAEYHYATPVSQISPLENIGLNVYNRESTPITGMVLKADVKEPDGNVTTLTLPLGDLPPGTDSLVFFDTYTPPALTGQFDVTFSNNKYTESRDTLRRSFVQTEYTWAMDKYGQLQLDGGAMRNDLFAGTLKYQIGALISTGPDGGVGKYCTFGIANIDSIYDPLIPLGNLISVILYDADLDNDGLLDLNNDFEADLGANIVGIGTYEMTGTEEEENLLDVIITDYITSDTGVELLPSHPYYITVLYDGTENGSGRNCAFTNSAYIDYLAFVNENNQGLPSTPMKIGTNFSYWGDRVVVTRLQLDGYTPSSTKNNGQLLDKSKYSVTPNPANDLVRLNLELTKPNSAVNVSILSGLGNTLRSQTLRDFQSGQINFDVRDVPSGTYLMWIRTTEGQTITQVTICH
jgi:hypothetical protein